MDNDGRMLGIKSPFDLPTFQKRIRHFRLLAIRNLNCKSYRGKDIMKMETYFSLHKDECSSAFYTSETLAGTMNPTWQTFDMKRHENEIDTTQEFLVVRIWVGHNKQYKLLISINLYLSGTVFLTEKLQRDSVKFPPNTVIFGMFDKYFVGGDDTSVLKRKTMANGQMNCDSLMVDQSLVRNSYTISTLSRIQTVLRAIKQTQAQVHRVHESIEEHLRATCKIAQKFAERERILMHLEQLHEELAWQTSYYQTQREHLEKLETEISKRRELLKEQRAHLVKALASHLEVKQSHVQTREKILKENAQLRMRQKQLVSELAQCIYPIKQVGKDDCFICDVRLPNAENLQGQDDVMIGVALGYTCHFTMMISQILDFPLRYQMEYRGSRSQVQDFIHAKLADKDRKLPLYPRGNKERFRFDYGVFLLNKNISQLRFYCGLGTTDLRLTLQNVKSLLELRLGVRLENSATPTAATPPEVLGVESQPRSNQSQAGSSSISNFVHKEQVLVEPDAETDQDSFTVPAPETPAEEDSEELFKATNEIYSKVLRHSAPAFRVLADVNGHNSSLSGHNLNNSSDSSNTDQVVEREHSLTELSQLNVEYDSSHSSDDDGRHVQLGFQEWSRNNCPLSGSQDSSSPSSSDLMLDPVTPGAKTLPQAIVSQTVDRDSSSSEPVHSL